MTMKFGLDPFQDDCIFLFYSKRRNDIKVLHYERNVFILVQKKLVEEIMVEK